MFLFFVVCLFWSVGILCTCHLCSWSIMYVTTKEVLLKHHQKWSIVVCKRKTALLIHYSYGNTHSSYSQSPFPTSQQYGNCLTWHWGNTGFSLYTFINNISRPILYSTNSIYCAPSVYGFKSLAKAGYANYRHTWHTLARVQSILPWPSK